MRNSRLKKISGNWLIGIGPKVWSFVDGKIVAESSGAAKSLRDRAILEKWQIFDLAPSTICVPTGFDWQVHLRFPGQSEKETLAGGLMSALDGGYDSVLTMPNTRPFLDEPALLKKSIIDCEAETQKIGLPIKVYFTAAGTKGMQGMEAANIRELALAGAVAITDDGWGVKSSDAQEAIFRACAESGISFLQHAEMPGHKGVASPSTFQTNEGLRPYPADAESQMVNRDLEILARVPGAHYHVLHVTTKKSVDLIRAAKARGMNVTAEVSPHHLFFDNSQIPAQSDPTSSFYKMNPPLFAPEDKIALREALADGTLDFVATDHAPHELEAKQGGWDTAPFGTRGMETALPVLVTLFKQGILKESRIAEVFSEKPRQLLPKNIKSQSTGFVFVDPEQSFKVELADLPGISQNSCFLGHELRGKVNFRIQKDGSLYKI